MKSSTELNLWYGNTNTPRVLQSIVVLHQIWRLSENFDHFSDDLWFLENANFNKSLYPKSEHNLGDTLIRTQWLTTTNYSKGDKNEILLLKK